MADNNIVVKLSDKEYTLRPSVAAMRTISRQYNGLRNARDMLVAENFDAVVFIIRVGAGLRDNREVNELDERIYETGLTGELLIQLINYVAMLGNRGQPIVLGEETESRNENKGNESF